MSPPTRVPSPQQKDLPAVPAATVGEAPAVVAAAEKQVQPPHVPGASVPNKASNPVDVLSIQCSPRI